MELRQGKGNTVNYKGKQWVKSWRMYRCAGEACT